MFCGPRLRPWMSQTAVDTRAICQMLVSWNKWPNMKGIVAASLVIENDYFDSVIACTEFMS